MSELGPKDLDELLGAYALDAVDGDERAAVEAYLETSPRARAEVADHREVAALLAGTGSKAPDQVWQRIAGSLEEAPPQLRLAVAPPGTLASGEGGSPTTSAGTRRWMVAAMAVAAAVILVLGAVVVRQGSRIGDIEDDLASAVDELESVDIETAAGLASVDPANQTVDLEGDGEVVVAVLAPDGSGYLLAGDLAPLGDDRTYQLWGIRDDTPVSLGVLGPTPDVAAFQADAPFDALAISEEDAGGAVAPTAPTLVGNVS